jgi:hypothetical protein
MEVKLEGGGNEADYRPKFRMSGTVLMLPPIRLCGLCRNNSAFSTFTVRTVSFIVVLVRVRAMLIARLVHLQFYLC